MWVHDLSFSYFSLQSEVCPNRTLTIGHDKVDVTSPFYPIHYPDNIDCFWRVSREQSFGHLVIAFMTVNLQSGEDFLTIGIGNDIIDSAVILRLSGNSAPKVATIDDPKFWLRFTSNSLGQISYTGFWLQIEWNDSSGNYNYILVFLILFTNVVSGQ